MYFTSKSTNFHYLCVHERRSINDGDLVVIDKSLEAKSGDYVAAFIDGEFTLKQFKLDEVNNCAWLIPANPKYEPIKVMEDNDFMVWGVITSCIKRFHKF